MKKIYIGSDHAGFELKKNILEYLRFESNEVEDLGTYAAEACDYPDFGKAVAEKVSDNPQAWGIIICGSGNGIAMVANKFKNIRCAISWNQEIASLARTHNDANILSLPARFVSLDEAKKMVNIFLNTDFEGGRHQKRVEKIG